MLGLDRKQSHLKPNHLDHWMSSLFTQSIKSLRAAIADGRVSALDTLGTALKEIAARNAVIRALTDVLAEDATREAEDAGAKPARCKLAGIPIAIKDNIDTVPAVCSAGLPFLSNYRPKQDAEVVRRLRAAGAVIVGVAATDSGAFGVTTPNVMNPLFAGKIVGGSSGGSAAAVAAGFCKAAIGTDTGGSIRIPAACCGIVGFKPTRGRVSAQGVRPLASSVDHVGPLAVSVADVRAVMEVIDPEFSGLPVRPRERPAVVGVPRSYFADALPAVHDMIDALVAALRRQGFGISDVEMPGPSIPTHLVLSLTEAALFHARNGQETLDAHPEAAKEGIRLGRSYTSSEHLQAQEHRREFVGGIDAVFAAVDFLLLPTLPVETPDRNLSEVMLAGSRYSILQALIRYTAAFDQSGHPVIAMPWSSPSWATPGSFQLVGPLNSDNELLDFAEIVERHTQDRTWLTFPAIEK